MNNHSLQPTVPMQLVILCCCALLIGCNETTSPVLPVLGKVLLDDKPVAGAKVLLIPRRASDDRGRTLPISYALTNEKGEFHLRTSDGRSGAAIGENDVFVMTRQTSPLDEQQREKSKVDTDDTKDPDDHKTKRIIRTESIPDRYHRRTTLMRHISRKMQQPMILSLRSNPDPANSDKPDPSPTR